MIYRLVEYLNSRPKAKYRILVPPSYSFGNCCEEITLTSLYCAEKNKKLIIIPPKIFQFFLKYKVANKHLLNNLIIQNKYNFTILNNNNKNPILFYLLSFLVNIEFLFRRSFALILKSLFNFKVKDINFFPYLGVPNYVNNFKEEISESDIKIYNFENLKINLDLKKNEFCKRQLEKYGINSKTKFVCLHVRDGTYKNDYQRRPQRNSDIKNYYKLISYLISKNYYVVRFGKDHKERIDIKNEKIIDYPFSNIKSDFMDLYLVENCDFFIGNLSGPLEAARMLNKPCLALDVNLIFHSFPRHPLSRSVFRKILRKKDNQILSIKKFIDLDIKYHHWKYLDNSLELLQLNEDELLYEIKEYYDLIENSKMELTQLQKDFNKSLLLSLIKKVNILKKENFNKKNDADIIFYQEQIFNIKNSKGSYSNNCLKTLNFN
tara:strand:+ start:819 stop:2120 length:1302 start_codon:yes stop_codon:yes gene_type:complete